ncbi:hypothetical protein F53441_10742 [Fusarium austroafricanum]|uniref:Uncharacterized protein n=1 Tax=Fusarium austroafricanum TaxID=2364996 RepID=A0A8H4K699_9HYPO|nr:hypothetical protein F53441_10742 [Fusarium austroafricanum]
MSDEGREYCTGDGSICEAYNKIDRKCRDETGKAYYKCTCESGWVPLQKACYDCRSAMGEFMINIDDSNRESCKDDGLSVAPIPSSIISQQKEYNETAKVPSMSETKGGTMLATNVLTASMNSDVMTYSHQPYTTTLFGNKASVTLPAISAPTEEDKDEENMAGRRIANGDLAASCHLKP